MKKVTLALMLFSAVAFAKPQYTSPMNGATLINADHEIIFRDGRLLDAASINNHLFTISGSKSGDHTYRVVFTRDQKTIILKPDQPFGYSEQVTVTLNSGLRTIDEAPVDAYSFTFQTDREYTAQEKVDMAKLPSIIQAQEQLKWGKKENTQDDGENTDRTFAGSVTILNNTAPSPGVVFYDAWDPNFGGSKYDGYAIMNNNGDSIFQSAKAIYDFDFSINQNGYLSVYNPAGHWDILDSNLQVIDSYYPGNGRTSDPHEFNLYSDGHALMVVEETHSVNMADYTNGQYHQTATLMNTIIQEFDQDKNVIFEWRSWDHVNVMETNQSLSASYIDVVHTNSIDVDTDGNIIASHRHLSQVTKIDRNTGEFIWRLGGDSNQFTIVGDPEGFSWEHCAKLLPNGHITLWDNGNGHVPTHSMAKEYSLDLTNMTATLVWSWQPKTYTNGNAYYYAMGGVQRLDNGNTMVAGGWDASTNQSNIWEVTPAGTVVWEAQFNNSKALVGYRAFRYLWNPCAPLNVASIAVTKITDTTVKVSWSAVANAASYDLQYRKLGNATWKTKNTTSTSKKLKNLKKNTSYEFQLRANCSNHYSSDWSPLDTFKTLNLKLSEQASAPLAIYPNPANDFVNINLNLAQEAPVTVTVYDLAGKKLMQTAFSSVEGEQSLQLNVSELPSAVYFADVKTGDDHSTLKFVKQ